MKKISLLGISAALACLSAFALNPSFIENVTVYHYSADGNWGAAENFYTSSAALCNTVTGEVINIEARDGELIRIGVGNCVSNRGTMLYNRELSCEKAYYLKDGKECVLPLSKGFACAIPNGISSDDRYIVGLGGYAMYNNESSKSHSVFALLWTLNADGTYGEPERIDYPTKDFEGLMPQTVIPASVSDDGSVITGQIVSCTGFHVQNLVWRKAADGTWSYTLLAEDLYHPEGVEDPGPAPEFRTPNEADFITDPQRRAEYYEAMKYYEEHWTEGVYPPNVEDYMTKEEIAAYEAANNAYYFEGDPTPFEEDQQAWMDWKAKNDKWFAALPSFGQNATCMSGNGKYLTAANNKDVYLFDLSADTYVIKTNSDGGLSTTGISNDGTIVAFDGGFDAYIAEVGDESFTKLSDYMNTKYPAIYDWMREYMRHDVTVEYWDPDLEEDVVVTYKDVMMTGQPRINADGTLIATWIENSWDFNSPTYLYTYLFPLPGFVGIENVSSDDAANALSVSMDRNGLITINGEASALSVYDLNGRLVLRVPNPASSVKTDLPAGSYILKAENAAAQTTAKALR